MSFFEWGINFNALKPVKNEIVIEQTLRYNLMYQPNVVNISPKTETGYGLYAAFGCRMNFQNNMALDVGLRSNFQYIKLSSFKGFTFSELLFLV